MTIAEAMIALQDAVATKLENRQGLIPGKLTGIYDYFMDERPAMPYLAFGPIEPVYGDHHYAGEADGTRNVELILTFWIFDNGPSKLLSLEALKECELALADQVLTLSYGTAAATPDIVIKKSEWDDTLGLWRMPVEVRQEITGV